LPALAKYPKLRLCLAHFGQPSRRPAQEKLIGYGVTVRVTLRLRFGGRLRSYVTLRGSIRTRMYVTRRNLLTAA
jgi:hypothetical protein